ncbi:hypothetical protein GIB67_040552 [Kingdonia uniflora]|uniref:Uncharacterized protein n=1 Tax=Kingdonia uniflora TaxID=39325 RepID=A0A7J7L5K3_9MAGN|nr:hypothetical protein GIB67_040552 [Kingdonia uniflora]
MASFRSYPPPPPPQSSNQSVLPPPPLQPPAQPGSNNNNNYHRGFPGAAVPHPGYAPNYSSNNNNAGISHYGPPSRTQPLQPPQPPQQQQQQQQQQHHQYVPQPPQTQSAYPPPPPLAPVAPPNGQPMYYPSAQYSQFDSHSVPPPPPVNQPPPPPPPSSPPPPPNVPPPSLPPPPPTSSGPPVNRYKERPGPSKVHGLPPKQKPPIGKPGLVPHGRAPNGAKGRVETEEERRIRKKREYEKLRQEEKHKQRIKESQKSVLHKTQMLASGSKGQGSMSGSRGLDKKSAAMLSSERIENRLKKQTTFICKLKFRNELPDPTAQPKLLSMNTNKDLYSKYAITSLEKMHKPKLFVEPDLGIPLDLLDISVYNPPSVRPPLAPEDEELLRDDEIKTPVKQHGFKIKERPTDIGLSWLVKTQYISPLSMDAAKTSLTEKQAKELRETRGGRSILDTINNREKQIQAIEASFEACKSRPVHATNDKLQPVEILPLLPDFERYDDQFVLAAFDSDPTADSELYGKLDKSLCDQYESQAIMKSFVGAGSDPAKPDKFLAYMVPSKDELGKDLDDEDEDMSYSWVREYQWDVRGDDVEDPTTYLVTFHEDATRYLPLPTKLNLKKKRPKEGKSSEEVEHYPVPSKVTVRRRPDVASVERKDLGGYSGRKGNTSNLKRGRSDLEDVLGTRQKAARAASVDYYSGAEEDMSD